MGNAESGEANEVPCGCGKYVELGGCYNNTLLGTVKLYHRHLLVCDGHDKWTVPKITQDPDSFSAKLCAVMKKYKPEFRADEKSVMAACSERSIQEGKTDIIVYPEALRYSLTESDLDLFVKTQVIDGKVCEELKPQPLSFKRLVLICTHGSRDKRCGRIGPQVKAKLKELLAARGLTESDVVVRGSSHLGGHKYAGVMVVYPEGDWYGYVTSRDSDKLITKYLTDDVIFKEKWRGRMGMTKEQMMSIPIVCTGHEIEDAGRCGDCPSRLLPDGGAGVKNHFCMKQCGLKKNTTSQPELGQHGNADAGKEVSEPVLHLS